MRATHEWRGWSYDCWGRHGRPVVLIHPVLFDRVMWWPAAAALRPHATVVAVDLPGHGGSGGRASYHLDDLVDELAHLVHSLATTRAPIVVGHASASPLAEAFAARYAVHALVIVDPLEHLDLGPVPLEDYLSSLSVDAVPARYRYLLDPVHDASLLKAYADCLRGTPPAHQERLVIHSRITQPPAGRPQGRHESYDVDGAYAHLTDVDRFVADLCALL